MTVNKQILLGHLGSDAELRMSSTGAPLCSFQLATNHYRKGSEGESETTWHSVLLLGTLAKSLGQYLKKGRLVYVEGRTEHRRWTGKDKVERRETQVVADCVRLTPGARHALDEKGEAGVREELGF